MGYIVIFIIGLFGGFFVSALCCAVGDSERMEQAYKDGFFDGKESGKNDSNGTRGTELFD